MAMRAGVAVAAFVASLAPPSVRGIGVPASAAPPPAVAPGMKSIGVAVKQSRLQKGVEKVVFEHALSPGADPPRINILHIGKSDIVIHHLLSRPQS